MGGAVGLVFSTTVLVVVLVMGDLPNLVAVSLLILVFLWVLINFSLPLRYRVTVTAESVCVRNLRTVCIPRSDIDVVATSEPLASRSNVAMLRRHDGSEHPVRAISRDPVWITSTPHGFESRLNQLSAAIGRDLQATR